MDVKQTFAFIEFEEEVDASDAIKFMDGSVLQERKLNVRAASSRDRAERGPSGPPGGGGPGGYPSAPSNDFRGPPPPRGAGGVAYGFRVEIENIAEKTSWQDLKDFGRQAGESIKYADIFNKPEGKSGLVGKDRNDLSWMEWK